jgi:TrmH family RNA methyltransferase
LPGYRFIRMATLTSRNNPKIKQIHHLLSQRKQRDSSGLFVVEGIRHVGEACAAHAGIEYICYSPDLLTSDFAIQLIQEQSKLGIPCLAVEKEIFSSLASKDNPQGILAVVSQPRLELDHLTVENFKWGVALVAPQDPGNIGSILRTVDAVGASGLLLLDDPANNQFCADPYHPSSVRASMGSIFWYPIVATDFPSFVQWARLHACHVCGTSAHSSQDYRNVEKYEVPLILLMGSEREGLTASQSAVCDLMLRIPMQGRVTSLNLAIATGVMLYSILNKI